MAIEITQAITDDGIVLLTLHGEMTMAEADDVSATLRPLRADDRTRFVFDFSDTPFLDSGGLRVLVSLYRDIHPLDGAVWIVGAARVVRQTFEITHLSNLLHLADTMDDALNGIRQSTPVPA